MEAVLVAKNGAHYVIGSINWEDHFLHDLEDIEDDVIDFEAQLGYVSDRFKMALELVSGLCLDVDAVLLTVSCFFLDRNSVFPERD